ncbi:MAG TPA: hypothetical protein VHG09_10600, partial [Longimicrobiales bacterium]|nr:hypothetical protein [Longimicrobiales bacterium]
YGFARAQPGDPGRVALQHAASYEARLSARIAEAIDADRSAGLDRLSDQTVELYQQSVVEYYDAILRPLMERAESDHRLAECCGMRWAQWERQIQLSLVDDQGRTSSPELETRRAQAQTSYERILQNQFEQGMDRAIRLCREEHDFTAIQIMFALLRGAELLGVPTNGRGEQVQEEIERCLSFEVEFRSSFDNRAPASTRMFYEVAADLPVQVNIFAREGAAFGTAPLEYVRFSATGNPKEAVWGKDGTDERTAWFDALTSVRVSPSGTRGSTFTVHAIEWDLNTIQKPGTDCDGRDVMQAGDTVVDFSVTFSPGTPIEVTRNEPANPAVAPFDTENTAWAWHWSQSHGDDRTVLRGVPVEDDELGGPFRMTLERTEPGTWSRRFDHDHGTELGFSLEERGHMIVRHAPK